MSYRTGRYPADRCELILIDRIVVVYSAVPRRPNWEFCPDGYRG
jgi:hypothetical protein